MDVPEDDSCHPVLCSHRAISPEVSLALPKRMDILPFVVPKCTHRSDFGQG